MNLDLKHTTFEYMQVHYDKAMTVQIALMTRPVVFWQDKCPTILNNYFVVYRPPSLRNTISSIIFLANKKRLKYYYSPRLLSSAIVTFSPFDENLK